MSRLSNGIALGVAGTALALSLAGPSHGQTVPNDAQPLCAVSSPNLAAMFESGSVTLNGVVKPADSRVNLLANCGFFNWSEQMFLWMTSPAPRAYGGGSHIMFSPSFYTVSPQFQEGTNPDGTPIFRRRFLPNIPGRPLPMNIRATELGPDMLPVTRTRAGKLIQVQRPDPTRPVPPVVRLQNGRQVRLSDVRRTPSGDLQFFSAGKPVEVLKVSRPPAAKSTMVKGPDGKMMMVASREALSNLTVARKIIVKGIPVLIDSTNTVIDTESGQADGGVLIAQNGSLVYYVTVVNDVFAYSRTMRGAPVIPKTTSLTMPTTAADATDIVNFAAAHGRKIVDPEALAIESKSSWVEATAVPDPQNYIQVTATVPLYTQSTDPQGNTILTPSATQTRTVKLVMVGMHVVGSTLGHGEMVWGSFEHTGNAPNAAYSYSSISGPQPANVPQGASGQWLFTPSGSTGPFNQHNVSWDDINGVITGSPGIQPMGVLRMHPWGSPGTATLLNTQVISSTASVMYQLVAGDVRRNYFQLGTTWTKGGQAPDFGGPGTNQVGTNLLANATLETFAQETITPPDPGTNCFSCHRTNTTTVSHSYNVAKPLF